MALVVGVNLTAVGVDDGVGVGVAAKTGVTVFATVIVALGNTSVGNVVGVGVGTVFWSAMRNAPNPVQ